MQTKPVMHLILGLGIALLFGCGGGGGGSSSSSSGVTYSGPTTAATITSTSDVSKLTTEALNGANSGTFVPGARVVESSSLSKADLVQTLTKLAELAQPVINPSASGPFSETISGSCGGSGILTGTDNSTPGRVDIAGTLSFSGYCVTAADGEDILINGSLSFTIAGTSSSRSFAMATQRLSLTIGGLSYVYSLEYSCQITGSTVGQVTLTATYLAPDGKTYRIVNYQVVVDAAAHTLLVSGRFYHPDYGYVDVSTPVIITYTYCGGQYRPTSGTLRVTGADGHYGEFVGVDCASYSLCLDGVCEPQSW